MSTGLTPNKVEDWILILAPFLTPTVLGMYLGLPLVPAIILGLAVGSFGKAIIGLAQWPKSPEDWVLLAGAVIAGVAVAAAGDPAIGVYALSVGMIGKGIIGIIKDKQIEDGFLIVGGVLGIFSIALGNAKLAEVALLFASLGKGFPGVSIGNPTAGPTQQTPAPVPPNRPSVG